MMLLGLACLLALSPSLALALACQTEDWIDATEVELGTKYTVYMHCTQQN